MESCLKGVNSTLKLSQAIKSYVLRLNYFFLLIEIFPLSQASTLEYDRDDYSFDFRLKGRPEFKSQLYHIIVTWAIYLTFVNLQIKS